MSQSISMRDKPQYFTKAGQTCVFYPISMERIYLRTDAFDRAVYGEREVTVEIPPPQMRMLQINMTDRCNMTCEYCAIYKNPYVSGQAAISTERIDAIVSRFYGDQKSNPPLVVIFGGEPMLAFAEMDYIVHKLPAFTTKVLFTNGTILRQEHIDKFRLYPNFHVIVSFDGLPGSHDAMRHFRGKESSTIILSNLEKMRRGGLPYGISLVVHKHNIDALVDNVEFILRELGPTSLGVNLPHYTESGTYYVDVAKYADGLIRIIDLAREYGVFVDQINRRLKPFITRKIRFRDCAACGEKLVFRPNGDFSNCVNYWGVSEDPGIWKDRIPILKGECWDCAAIGICGGGCIADGIKFFGGNSFDERNCYVARQFVQDFIWRFQDESQIEAYACLLEMRFHQSRFSIGHITDDG